MPYLHKRLNAVINLLGGFQFFNELVHTRLSSMAKSEKSTMNSVYSSMLISINVELFRTLHFELIERERMLTVDCKK